MTANETQKAFRHCRWTRVKKRSISPDICLMMNHFLCCHFLTFRDPTIEDGFIWQLALDFLTIDLQTFSSDEGKEPVIVRADTFDKVKSFLEYTVAGTSHKLPNGALPRGCDSIRDNMAPAT